MGELERRERLYGIAEKLPKHASAAQIRRMTAFACGARLLARPPGIFRRRAGRNRQALHDRGQPFIRQSLPPNAKIGARSLRARSGSGPRPWIASLP